MKNLLTAILLSTVIFSSCKPTVKPIPTAMSHRVLQAAVKVRIISDTANVNYQRKYDALKELKESEPRFFYHTYIDPYLERNKIKLSLLESDYQIFLRTILSQ